MLIRIPHNLNNPPALFEELGGVRLLVGGLLCGPEDVAQKRCKMLTSLLSTAMARSCPFASVAANSASVAVCDGAPLMLTRGTHTRFSFDAKPPSPRIRQLAKSCLQQRA